jgi:hypothetical protein
MDGISYPIVEKPVDKYQIFFFSPFHNFNKQKQIKNNSIFKILVQISVRFPLGIQSTFNSSVQV